MNDEVSGTLSVIQFLSIIQGRIEMSKDRIEAGCKKDTHAVEPVKNRLLAVELEKLFNRA